MTTVIVLFFTALGFAGLYFLLGSGLSLIYGLMNVLNMAHGLLFAVGAYAVLAWVEGATWVGDLTARLVSGVVVAAGVGIVLGVLLERGLLARLYGDHLAQLLVTIGVSFAGIAALSGMFGHDGRTVPLPNWLRGTVQVAGATVATSRFVVFGGAALMLVALLLFLARSRHGLIIRAGVENRTMVQALGINVERSFTLVFAIGGALATVGGALGAVYFGSINPHVGTTQLIYAFIVVIIGGLGSIVGTAVAAVAVAIVQVFINYYAGAGYGDIAVVAMLAAVLLVRPAGLLGKASV